MSPAERNALDGFAAAVRAHYGAQLRDILVFGSRARGDNKADSDVDVAIILKDGSWEAWREQRLLVDLGTDIFVETGLNIEPWVFAESDWTKGQPVSGLLKSVLADAKPIRDAA